MQPSNKPSPMPVRAWLALLSALALAVVLLLDAPAWAAPVLRPPNQTVPRPTPTSSFDPIATATPRPDDDDDNGDTVEEGVGQPVDEAGPSGEIQLFPQEPVIDPSGPGAMVTVAVLNVRAGPGTNFDILGSFSTGNRVIVLSRTADGAWWYVCCLPGTSTAGWISSQLVTPDFERSQADRLIPVFGSKPTPTPAPGSAAESDIPQPPSLPAQPASRPLVLDFILDPPFVWQGITATLTISVTNPNEVDVQNVELSDELPAALTLESVTADAGGEIEQNITPSGNTLVIVRWRSVPANTGVTASLIVAIDPVLDNGAVVDDLVAVSGDNAPYNSSAFTIGMPPVLPPAFE